MSRPTLILVIILAITTGVLLYVNSIQKQYMTRTQIPTVTPVVGHTSLSLTQATTSTNVSSVSATIDTGGDKAVAVQLELAYDPKILTHVRVVKGTFFANSVELFNQVDAVNGRISYAIGISPSDNGQSGLGTVATIYYTLADPLPVGTGNKITSITFLPRTKVTSDKTSQTVLVKTTDTTLPLLTR